MAVTATQPLEVFYTVITPGLFNVMRINQTLTVATHGADFRGAGGEYSPSPLAIFLLLRIIRLRQYLRMNSLSIGGIPDGFLRFSRLRISILTLNIAILFRVFGKVNEASFFGKFGMPNLPRFTATSGRAVNLLASRTRVWSKILATYSAYHRLMIPTLSKNCKELII